MSYGKIISTTHVPGPYKRQRKPHALRKRQYLGYQNRSSTEELERIAKEARDNEEAKGS